MVDSPGLENRYSSLFRTIEGSNPSLSFCSLKSVVSLLVCTGPVFFYNEKGMARLSHLAKPEKNRLEKRN